MTHLALRTWRHLETSSAADLGWAMSSVLRYGSSAGSNLAPTMKNVELSMEIMWKLIEINGNNVVCFNGNDGLQLGYTQLSPICLRKCWIHQQIYSKFNGENEKMNQWICHPEIAAAI